MALVLRNNGDGACVFHPCMRYQCTLRRDKRLISGDPGRTVSRMHLDYGRRAVGETFRPIFATKLKERRSPPETYAESEVYHGDLIDLSADSEAEATLNGCFYMAAAETIAILARPAPRLSEKDYADTLQRDTAMYKRFLRDDAGLLDLRGRAEASARHAGRGPSYAGSWRSQSKAFPSKTKTFPREARSPPSQASSFSRRANAFPSKTKSFPSHTSSFPSHARSSTSHSEASSYQEPWPPRGRPRERSPTPEPRPAPRPAPTPAPAPAATPSSAEHVTLSFLEIPEQTYTTCVRAVADGTPTLLFEVIS